MNNSTKQMMLANKAAPLSQLVGVEEVQERFKPSFDGHAEALQSAVHAAVGGNQPVGNVGYAAASLHLMDKWGLNSDQINSKVNGILSVAQLAKHGREIGIDMYLFFEADVSSPPDKMLANVVLAMLAVAYRAGGMVAVISIMRIMNIEEGLSGPTHVWYLA